LFITTIPEVKKIFGLAHPGESVGVGILKKYGDKFLKVIYEKSNDKIT